MKKIGGKAHYFGTDLEEALKRYALGKDRLAAGLKPLRNDTRPTVSELGNVFCDAKKKAESLATWNAELIGCIPVLRPS